MKRYVKIINFILIILLILQIVFPVIMNIDIDISYAAAITYTEGGVTYTYSNDSNAILTITALDSGKITSNWKTSEQLKGYVTSIKRVNIQSTIISIGDYAFSGCTSLETVCIGNGNSDYVEKLKTITNGDYTYSEQKGLETIGNYAFFGCTSLSKFSVKIKMENISGSREFNRTVINMLNYNVTSIGNYAFFGCTQLKVFTLNENITYNNIGINAFDDSIIVRYAENKFTYNNRIKINKDLTVNIPIGGTTKTKKETLLENMTFLKDDKVYVMTRPGTCQHTINSIKITLTNIDTKEIKEWTVKGAGNGVDETTITPGLLRYDCVTIPNDGNYKIDAEVKCTGCDMGSNSSGAAIQYLYMITREYPVIYNGNGSTSGNTESQTKIHNVDLTLNDNGFSKTGYTFNNWNTTQNGTGITYFQGNSYTNNEALTLYAQWKRNNYNLVVKPNGGTWNNSTNNQSFTIAYEGTRSISLPTKTGYTFTGWTLEGTETGSSMSSLTEDNATFTMGTANATLTANWRINTSTLQVNPAGGTWSNSTQVQNFTQNYNTTKKIPVPTREGYTFKGWTRTGDNGSLSSTTSAATYTFGASNGITDIITATWQKNQYQLEVKPNGGEWKGNNQNQKITIDYGGTEVIPVPSRTGYSFTKWELAGEGSRMSSLTANNATFTMGASNATLIANWERNNYELEVRPNGGMWKESIESEESKENQNFTLAYEGTKQILLPRRNGYKFIGWTLEGRKTGSEMSSLMEDNATFKMGYANAILMANWELIKQDMTGIITWNDEQDKYISRPSEVEVTLNSDEEVTEIKQGALETPATKTVLVTSTTSPYGFENLQTKKIKDNTNYDYAVSQNKIVGYETIVNGYDITNNLILPTYTSQVVTTPRNNLESEFVKNEEVQIVGMITASSNNRDKVGTYREEVKFEVDSGIQINKDSIKISYIDKEGNTKEITDYTVEDNTIRVNFEKNREEDNTAGDSLKIEVNGTMQEVKEYTNTISYVGYLRDYETGEDTNINLGTLTTASETITVGKVSISIKEVNEENEITDGSHFEIRKKETGEVVQSFITKGELEAIRKLEPMVEYVVIETKPILGYTTAEEARFMLNKQGEIVIESGAEKEENTIIIRDYKTRLQVEIRDELSNEYVTGPTWQVIRKTEENGQIVEEIVAEWTSEGKEHKIEKLPIGEYTLREIGIGKETGYVTIEDITFEIEDTKELQILEVEQKVSKVRVHLRDIETENYVEGAILQIVKRAEENGKLEEKVIRECTTEEGGNLELKLPIGEYIIREIKLPEHSGYATIEEQQIKVIDTTKEQQVEIKQDFTKIRIKIIDEETKEKIDDLEITIVDKETKKEVAKTKSEKEQKEENMIIITETEEGYYLERLPIGEYIIKEKTPEGYKEVEEIEMKVEDTEKLQIVNIENKRLIYDMQVEKELVSITIDGEKRFVPKGELQKVEVRTSKIKTADIRLEYIIRVSNVGETKATIGTIIDNVPEGFKLISTDWKQEGRKAIYNAEKEELKPSESKEVKIVLKWENNESNFGEKKNTAELKGNTNPYGYEDKTTENNIGEEITIFSVKTGLEEKTSIIKIIVIIVLVSMIIGFVAKIEIAILKRNKRY